MSAQQTTTIRSARDCRSSYGRRRDPNFLEIKKARRLVNSRTVERVAEARLPTDFGEFRILGYRFLNSNEEFVVLVKGELLKDRPTLVSVDSQCLTGDGFGSTKCDCGQQLGKAMELMQSEGSGSFDYQMQE